MLLMPNDHSFLAVYSTKWEQRANMIIKTMEILREWEFATSHIDQNNSILLNKVKRNL